MTKSTLTPAELEERRALIFALLEEAPYTIGNLAALMRLHRGAVAWTLKALAREQHVHRGADDRWRIGARPAAAAASPAPIDDDLAGAELPDEDDEPEDLDDVALEEPPVERRRALRQPSPTTSMLSDAAPSWWTTASRDGFSRRATIEHRRMRGSKEAGQVGLRLLQ